MRAGIPLTWIALLTLAGACADDAPATTAVTAATAITTATAATTSATTGATTGTTTADPTTSGPSGATTDEGEVGGTPITSTADPSDTAVTADPTSDPSDPGMASTDDGGDTSTGEPPLPGCGAEPPADFQAKPSAPANNASLPAPTADLAVTITGEILADASAEFHLREIHPLTDADDFTIVILPDTQNYTQFPGNFPQYPAQTKWVWDHRSTDNIVALLHNGDVVQHGNMIEVEWERADTAMKTIEASANKFPAGIPYSVAVGNHDNAAYAHADKPFSTDLFNKYFGVARFKDRAYYGGHYGKKNDNSWIVVRAGNLDIVMLSLEYRGALGQDPDVLAWAKGIFKDHPDALGIVNSHHIVKANGDFSGEGKQIYAVMKTVDNVQLMTSGHIKEFRARRTDKFNNSRIHSMLADYQDLIVKADKCAGGCGYMRIWRFSPKKNELKVETYSPSLKKSMTGPQEQFTLPVDLSAATGLFTLLGKVSGPGPTLTYPADALKPGKSYEWYAIVKECGAKVTTPTRKFTTQ